MKTAIIAGGCGLIGKEIVHHFKKKYHTYSVDLNEKADIQGDISNVSCLNEIIQFYNINIFVNASYPEGIAGHLYSFYYATRYIARYMSKNNGGSIINFASIYGVIGAKWDIYNDTTVEHNPSYSMIKGGIIALSRDLATQYGKHNVRINCVSPGGVFDNQDSVFVKRYCDRVPLGRMAEPNDIAHACLFLAENEYITGQNLIIDGGLTAQ